MGLRAREVLRDCPLQVPQTVWRGLVCSQSKCKSPKGLKDRKRVRYIYCKCSRGWVTLTYRVEEAVPEFTGCRPHGPWGVSQP